MNYHMHIAPPKDGTYWVRLAGTDTWFTLRIIGAETETPVAVGGLSGSAIQLTSLRGADFRGPIPTPDDPEKPAPWRQVADLFKAAADDVTNDILRDVAMHEYEHQKAIAQ